ERGRRGGDRDDNVRREETTNPVKRAAVALLVALALPAVAFGDDSYPAEAQGRYQEALALSRQNRHKEAAAAFRSVAEWREGGPFRARIQALSMSAKELELAGDLEGALATYRELERRFPEDPMA